MSVHSYNVLACAWLVLSLVSVSGSPIRGPHTLHRSRRDVLSSGYALVRKAWRPSFIRRMTAMRSLWGPLAMKAEEKSIKSLSVPRIKQIPRVKQGRNSILKRIKNYFYKMRYGKPTWGTAAEEEAVKSIPVPNMEQPPAESMIKRIKTYIYNKIKSGSNPNGGIGTLVRDAAVQVGVQKAVDGVSDWLENQQNGKSEEEDESPRRHTGPLQAPPSQQMTRYDPLQQVMKEGLLQQATPQANLELLKQAISLQQLQKAATPDGWISWVKPEFG